MVTGWLHAVLSWVHQHPGGAGAFVFAVAALESLPFIGLLVPGVIIMFGIGALIAAGALKLVPTLALAAAGAIVGDGSSYFLGRLQRDRVTGLWPFRRYPSLIRRGRSFFARHGAKSVLLGRFVGPVRPIVPVVAGAAAMPPLAFFSVSIPSALAWAPTYILPGVVFGASVGLAAAVATRLAILLLVVAGTVWFMLWSSRSLFVLTQPALENGVNKLLDWSQRHRRLGLLGSSLADPSQPEAPGLAILALILILGAWGLYILSWGWGMNSYPSRMDGLVYHVFQHLHTPWSDVASLALAQLSDWRIYVPLAVVIFISLLVFGRTRAAAHWVAAVAFGGILAFTLQSLVSIPQPLDFYLQRMPRKPVEGHIILSTVIYGFLPIILSGGRRRLRSWPYYATAGSVIALTSMARLYLGDQWFSDVAISAGVGLIWVTLLGVAYRRHHMRPAPTRRLALIAILTVTGAAAVTWTTAVPAEFRLYHQPRPTREMSAADWHNGGYSALPPYRIDLQGRGRYPLNVQWLGRLPSIRSTLEANGWRQPPDLTLSSALLCLSSSSSIAQLPVLPQVHDGRSQALVFTFPINARHQWVLRLWSSGWNTVSSDEPIWVGSLNRQRLRNWLSIVRIPSSTLDFETPLGTLAGQLGNRVSVVNHPRARPIPPRINWSGKVLLIAPPGR